MFELYNLCLQSSFASQILSFISLLEVVFVLVPMLLSVAFITVAERKTMASMQRRLGPNIVGYYGLLQAFADALKLLLKEYISPTQANKFLFFLGPVVTLVFSLLGFSVIPYAPGIMISDFNLGILYMLAMSSLSTYGILLSGWSANSKYAFLGSLRSTAQLISYELILSSAILLVILFSGSLSLTVNIEAQKAVWYAIPLLPVFIIFFIGSVAETNRAPFDLVEAESELVSGYMTEHAAVVFVFFFLAEYASILLICILSSMLFLGGYLPVSNLMDFIPNVYDNINLFRSSNELNGLMGDNNLLTDYSMESQDKDLFLSNNKSFKTQNNYKSLNNTIPYEIYNYLDDLNTLKNKHYIDRLNTYKNKLDKIHVDNTMETRLSEYNNMYKSYISLICNKLNNTLECDTTETFHSIFNEKRVSRDDTNLERLLIRIPDIKGASIKKYEYFSSYESFTVNPILNGVIHSVILGVKSCIMVFIFIWTRASYPRIRYDQLMSFCWTILLPLIIAIIILLPCILYSFSILPNNIFLL